MTEVARPLYRTVLLAVAFARRIALTVGCGKKPWLPGTASRCPRPPRVRL